MNSRSIHQLKDSLQRKQSRQLVLTISLLVLLLVAGLLWAQVNIRIKDFAQNESDAMFNTFSTTLSNMHLSTDKSLYLLQKWDQQGVLRLADTTHAFQIYQSLLTTSSFTGSLAFLTIPGEYLQVSTTNLSSAPIHTTGTIDTDSTTQYPYDQLWFNHALIHSNKGTYWSYPYPSASTSFEITVSRTWSDATTGVQKMLAFQIPINAVFSEVQQSENVTSNLKTHLFITEDLSESSSNSQDLSHPFFLWNSDLKKSVVATAFQKYGITHKSFGTVYRFRDKGKRYWIRLSSVRLGEGLFLLGWITPDQGIRSIVLSQQKNFLIGTFFLTILFIGGIIVALYWYAQTFNVVRSATKINTMFSSSNNVDHFLTQAVELIAKLLRAPVCSIYFFEEEQQQLVLKATHGLNKNLVGTTSLAYGEGLVGQTLKEMRALRVNSAQKLDSFHPVEGLNEEQYDSFLAVPITRGIHKLGVVVVQNRSGKNFQHTHVTMLEVLSHQIVSVMESARALVSPFSETKHEVIDPTLTTINGRVGAPGQAIGSARVEQRNDILLELRQKNWDKVYTLEQFEQALKETYHDLSSLQKSVEDHLADSVAMIFTAHTMMLEDESMSGAIREQIINGVNPPEAIIQITDNLVRTFLISPVRTLQEKADDIKDLAVRLLFHLEGRENSDLSKEGTITISRELFPSNVIELYSQGVLGIILQSGGATSHVAILCRSLNIPLLISSSPEVIKIADGTQLLLNAHHGKVEINPSPQVIKEYYQSTENSAKSHLLPAEEIALSSGESIDIQVNINLMIDVAHTSIKHIGGIGLYRSEFPFMIRDHFPSEAEQFSIYEKVAKFIGSKPFTFRTLDIGGDKSLPYYQGTPEENPFLGVRAIRFSMKERGEFKKQIRAILRAGDESTLRIMFPMVQSPDEVIELKEIVKECQEELKIEGRAYNPSPKIGIMVELPAAVTLIDTFAHMVDFVSIGTNDLIQYLLGVDRTNAEVADLYKPHHPAVLRSLKKVIRTCNKEGVSVSLCGDMANDTAFIPFLLGIGLRTFSVDSTYIGRVQQAVSSISKKEAFAISQAMLTCATAEDVELIMRRLHDQE